jgi:hypothetical protein
MAVEQFPLNMRRIRALRKHRTMRGQPCGLGTLDSARAGLRRCGRNGRAEDVAHWNADDQATSGVILFPLVVLRDTNWIAGVRRT